MNTNETIEERADMRLTCGHCGETTLVYGAGDPWPTYAFTLGVGVYTVQKGTRRIIRCRACGYDIPGDVKALRALVNL